MIEIRPIVQAVGPDNPSKQISVNNWNLGHQLTASPNVLIGTDGAGVEKEFTIGMGPGQIPDGGLIATALDGKVSVSGDVMTGTLEVSNAVTVKAPGGVNGNYWLVNETDVRRGVFYWQRSDDTVRLRAIMPNGVTLASEIILSPTEFTFQLGATEVLTVTQDSATFEGSLYAPTVQADDGIVTIVAPAGGNSTLWLRNEGNISQGLLFWERSTDTFRMRRSNVAGNAPEGEISISATDITASLPLTVPDDPYGPTWDGNNAVPTKNAIYDKIQTLAAPTILWGNITGTLSNQTDLQTALNAKANLTGGNSFSGTQIVTSGNVAVAGTVQVSGAAGSVDLIDRDGVGTISLYNNVDKFNVSIAASTRFSVDGSGNAILTGNLTVLEEAYAPAWNGKFEVPTKNAVFDKIESVVAIIPPATSSIVGITGTKAEFNTALTDDNFAYLGTANAFTANQTISLASPALTLNPVSGTSTIDLRGTASTNDGVSLRASGATASFCADTTLWRNRAASVTFGTLNSTNLTMTVPIVVPDVAYAPAWDGDFSVPTKNAVYDKINSMGAGGAVDDTAYGASWDGVTTIAPSKNAVYDKIEALSVGGGGVTTFNTRSGAVTLTGADVSAAGASANFSVTNTGADAYATVNGGANAAYVQLLRSGGAAQIKLTTLNDIEFNNGVGAITINGETNVDFQINDLSKLNIASAKVVSTVPVEVPDLAYAVGWNGSVAVPTRNAVYDKIEAVIATIPAATTSIVGITGTLAQFNTALTDHNFAAIGQDNNFTSSQSINAPSAQLTLNPSSGSSVFELMGAAGTQALRLQGTTGNGYARADIFSITNKTGAATYAVFDGTGLAVTGKISSVAAQGSVLTGVDQIQLREPGLSTGYTFNMGYLNAAGGNGWQGALDVLKGGVGGFLTLNPSGGTVVCGGALNVTGAVTSGGSTLATVSQLANYLPLTGGTLSGPLTGTVLATVGATNGISIGDRDLTGAITLYNSADSFKVYIASGDRLEVGATGTTVGGTLTVTGASILVNTDKLLIQHSTNGYVRTQAGGGDLWLGAGGANIAKVEAAGIAVTGIGTFTSYVQPDQARFASTVNPNFILAKWTGTSPTVMHRVDATAYYILLSDANAALTGSFNALRPFLIDIATGALTSSNGQTFGGGTSVTSTLSVAGNFSLTHATAPTILMGPGPMARVSAYTNTLALRANGIIFEREADGAALATIGTDGGIPVMTVGGKRVFRHSNASFLGSDITYSTGAPSGGADGDIWLQYV